jgi:hypothetical protein
MYIFFKYLYSLYLLYQNDYQVFYADISCTGLSVMYADISCTGLLVMYADISCTGLSVMY